MVVKRPNSIDDDVVSTASRCKTVVEQKLHLRAQGDEMQVRHQNDCWVGRWSGPALQGVLGAEMQVHCWWLHVHCSVHLKRKVEREERCCRKKSMSPCEPVCAWTDREASLWTRRLHLRPSAVQRCERQMVKGRRTALAMMKRAKR